MYRTRFASPGQKPFPIGPRDDRRRDPFGEPLCETSFQFGYRHEQSSSILEEPLSLTQHNSLDVDHDLQTGTKSHMPTQPQMNLGETMSEDPSIPRNPSHLRPSDKGQSNQPGHAGPPYRSNGMPFS